jgi:hypothetical protein
MNTKAFISYRREGGWETSRLIFSELQKRDIDAFLDVEKLGRSLFDEQLFHHIDESANFILILSPGALDRCSDENDWLRKEIAYAISKGKNIVPVLKDNYIFPASQDLPEDIRKICRFNCVSLHHEYIGPAFEKLISFLVKEDTSTAPTDSDLEQFRQAAREVLDDGNISRVEQIGLDNLMKVLNITPDIAQTILEEVRSSAGNIESISTARTDQTVTSEANAVWPDVGINFLKAVLSSVDLLKLPFSPQHTSAEKDIADELEVDWYLNNKYYFCVWLPSKRLDKVHVQWGIYSENASRDPLFRQTCDALYQVPELLDKKGDVSVKNIKYFFESGDNYLGFETNERKSITELADNRYVQYVVEQLIVFANAIWPVVQKNLIKE